MSTLLVVILVILLLGGLGYGGGVFGSGNRFWGTGSSPVYGVGGILGVVVLLLLIVYLLGGIGGHHPVAY